MKSSRFQPWWKSGCFFTLIWICDGRDLHGASIDIRLWGVPLNWNKESENLAFSNPLLFSNASKGSWHCKLCVHVNRNGLVHRGLLLQYQNGSVESTNCCSHFHSLFHHLHQSSPIHLKSELFQQKSELVLCIVPALAELYNYTPPTPSPQSHYFGVPFSFSLANHPCPKL